MTEPFKIAKLCLELSNESGIGGLGKLFTDTTTYSSPTTGVNLDHNDFMTMQRAFHGKLSSLAWCINPAKEVKPGIVPFDYDFIGVLLDGEKVKSSGLEYGIVHKSKIQHIEIRNNAL